MKSRRRIAFAAAFAAWMVGHETGALASVSGATIATPETGGEAAAGALATVDPSTGTLHATYSFDLLTARGHVQPSLALAYSSASGMAEAGYGWGLVGAAAIERRHPSGARGAPTDIDPPNPAGDRMYFGETPLVPICVIGGGSCSNGDERLPGWANGWMYFRAEVEGIFARFFWSPDRRTWVVDFKSGETMELGVPRDDSSYQRALFIDEAGHPLRWSVVRRYDVYGARNRVTYQWDLTDDRGTAYLTDIYDTPDDKGNFAHRTHLDYEDRQYLTVSLAPRWYQTPRKKLTEVTLTSATLASAQRELVARYALHYLQDRQATTLFLVQKEGRCNDTNGGAGIAENVALAGPTNCPTLPATTISFVEPLSTSVTTISGPAPDPNDGPVLADVNSDGLPDLVVPAKLVTAKQTVYLNGVVNGRPTFTTATMDVKSQHIGAYTTDFLTQSRADNVIFGNFNGDGRLNVLWHYDRTFAIFSPFSTIGGGSDLTWYGADALGQLPQELGLAPDQQPAHAFGDVDGDGLIDMVSAGAVDYFSARKADGTILPFARTINHPTEQLPGGDSAPVCDYGYQGDDSASRWISLYEGNGNAYLVVADMNGDGLGDHVQVQESSRYQCVDHPGDDPLNFNCGHVSCDWCSGNWIPSCYRWQRRTNGVVLTVRPGYGNGQFASPYVAASDADIGASFELLDDLNADGLADAVYANDDGILVKLGIGWNDPHAPDTLTQFSGAVDASFSRASIPGWDRSKCLVRSADMDGSGTTDVVVICPGAVTYKSFDGGQPLRKLATIDNGVGAFTMVTYASSVTYLPPSSTSSARTLPQPMQVVASIKTVNGLPGAKQEQHAVAYDYAEPVFDGPEARFRGFRDVTVRPITGADASGTATHTKYLVPVCDDLPGGQPCVRSIDRPNDALRGLPVVVESFVASAGGTNSATQYHSTRHFTYQLRTLYTGMDGRLVRFAFPEQTDTYVYETTPFTPFAGTDSELEVHAINEPQLSTTVSVPVRASAKHLRTRRAVDGFGNETDVWDDGRLGLDSTIHTQRAWQAFGSEGWWYRMRSTQTDGTGPGKRYFQIWYDDQAQASSVQGWLEGGVLLDRHHEDSTRSIAPQPPNASALAGWVTLASYKYDGWGHITHASGPDGRCRDQGFDDLFHQLPTSQTVYAGNFAAGQQDACGDRALTTFHSFDRGLEKETMTMLPSLAFTLTSYDGFGRVKEVRRPSDSPHVNVRVDYPTVASGPVQLVHASVSTDGTHYRDGWTYLDGFGREVLSLQQADVSAGDGGAWIASGLPDRDSMGRVVRSYDPGFYGGAPDAYPLSASPSSRAATTTYDAYGRVGRTQAIDGTTTSVVAYHQLSIDVQGEQDLALNSPPTTTFTDGHGRTIRKQHRLGYDSKDVLVIDTTYRSTGELASVDQYHTGGTPDPHIVRTMDYDSFGRVVRNSEPNTMAAGTDSITGGPTHKTWLYAYDDAGDLVGTSDARGCGKNIFYDAAGRLVAEDYSPCLDSQPLYSPIQLASGNVVSGDGTETFHVYDFPEASEAPGDFGSVSAFLMGHLVASYDRATHSRFAYDNRGRSVGLERQIAKPGDPTSALASRYAPWWYRSAASYDDGDRVVSSTTGADVPELMVNGRSVVAPTYSGRGVVTGVDSSYGALAHNTVVDADGFVRSQQFGDTAGTTASFAPDSRRRIQSAQVRRSMPNADNVTRQSLLAANTYGYVGGMVTLIADERNPSEWQSGAMPVSQAMDYDSLGQLKHVTYKYAAPNGIDGVVPPLQAETQAPIRTGYVPFHSVATRVGTQSFDYDWAGNLTFSDDDAHAFWDRSFGVATIGNGVTAGPNQLIHAGASGMGTVDAAYDAAGNLIDLVVTRDHSQCADTGECVHHFVYDWDEVGRLARARRWDTTPAPAPPTPGCPTPKPCKQAQLASAEASVLPVNQRLPLPIPPTPSPSPTPPRPTVPSDPPIADQSFAYDETDSRVLKVANHQGHVSWVNAEIFGSLRLEHAAFDTGTGDYERTAYTESVYLAGGLGRLLYAPSGAPAGKPLRVLLEVGNHLGSTSIVIDKDSSELVERATYQAYGATESDYRPTRWNSFRERYRLTGKEEDLDIGLTYFGARYYVAGLGRWASADPMTIHSVGADLNPYAYVSGSPLSRIDPLGLDDCVMRSSKGGMHVTAQEGSPCGDSSGKDSGENIVEAPPPSGAVGGGGGGGWTGPVVPELAPASTDDPGGQDMDPGFGSASISLQHINEVGYDASFSGEAFGQELWNDLALKSMESGIACLTSMCIPIPGITSWAADGVASSLSLKYDSAPMMSGNTINGSKIAAHGTVMAIEMVASMGAAGLAAGARGLAGAAGEGVGAFGAPRAYSVAFEMKLAPSQFGLPRDQHFELARQALKLAMRETPELSALVGGAGKWGRPPTGWTWHHDVPEGIMQLVPRVQHTPGSPFWNVLHPGGVGGYSTWAIPAGAPPN